MESKLTFYQQANGDLSDCGSVLVINESNHHLDWPGVVLEKGSSPHFYPDNVYTPYFYFALALEQDLNWQVETEQGTADLHTTPGSVWINPPETPFSHQIDEPCYFVILAVEKQRFLEACPLSIKDKALTFLNNYNVLDQTISGIIDLFLLEAKANGRNGAAYVQNLLSLLSTHYIQNYSNYFDLLEAKSKTSKFDQSQVDKVDLYIEQNMNKHIAIDDLADLLGCSKYYFLREFKKFVGDTPYQYLISRRLAKAKQLLEAQQGNIAMVAYELGFNDQAHFTRTFKGEFAMTPGQYLKNLTP